MPHLRQYGNDTATTIIYEMTCAKECTYAGIKESECVKLHGNCPCICLHACILMHAFWAWCNMCAPLEEPSKSVITVRQINSFYFLRQMSWLTLMVCRGDWGMSGEYRQQLGKLMIPLWYDLYQRSLMRSCLWQYPLLIVFHRVNSLFHTAQVGGWGHTLSPFTPLGPGAPASPLNP